MPQGEQKANDLKGSWVIVGVLAIFPQEPCHCTHIFPEFSVIACNSALISSDAGRAVEGEWICNSLVLKDYTRKTFKLKDLAGSPPKSLIPKNRVGSTSRLLVLE